MFPFLSTCLSIFSGYKPDEPYYKASNQPCIMYIFRVYSIISKWPIVTGR